MQQVYTSVGKCSRAGIVTAVLVLFGLLQTYAQTTIETAKQYVVTNAGTHNLTAPDVNGAIVSSAYQSPTTGWYHVYFNQAYQSVEIYNRLMSVVLVDSQVAYLTHNFIPRIDFVSKKGSLKGLITPLSALQKAVANLGLNQASLTTIRELITTKLTDGTLTQSVFSIPALSDEKINVKLYWLPVEVDQKGQKQIEKLALTWNVRFLTKDAQKGWNIHVDAASGDIVQKTDDVIHCNFGGPHQVSRSSVGHASRDQVRYFGQDKVSFVANSYTVFDYPLESPNHGSRTVSVNPYTRFVPSGTGPSTTNGWHNDGTTNYLTTRGNNVWAQEDTTDIDSIGYSPTSVTKEFNYPYTLGLNTASSNQNAAITNLFYWNNLLHDVLWKFGFDEPSGNFQNNNRGRGGLGNDFVYADAQDGGSTNNANFYPPPDGINGRMQMYLWTIPTTYQADGDFDNGIIAHEYAHGWSTRLTGGPANSSCLQNAEQGGEGWSDYLALMLTTNWSSLSATVASANIPRGIGTYAIGEPTTGIGIRNYAYSYDMANVNGAVTYAKIGDSNFSIPHGVGSIWATMLWDMTWEIILQDNQITPNIYDTPTSVTAMRGNIAALKLVNEGLRLQPCSPSFVQSRDAILQADQLLFGGRYRCAIGRAFARRGLGANASTGASSNDRIVIEDYTPLGGNTLSSPTLLTVCSGTSFTYTATSSTTGVSFSWTRPAVTGISNATASVNSAIINETLVNTTNQPVSVPYSFLLNPSGCVVGTFPQSVSVVVNPVSTPTVGSYSVCQNAAVPAGEGLVVPRLILNTVKGALSTSSPTYVRASGDDAIAYVAGYTVYYQSFTFTAPVSGPLTVGISDAALSDGFNDTYLSLYKAPFNPASPATNFLHGDDDSGPAYLSQLTHTLTKDTTYVLVVATYFGGVTGPFTAQANGPVFLGGLPNWFTASTGGTPIATDTLFNPVGLAGSGIPNTATAGTTTFYVARPDYSACRVATTFTVLTTAPPVVSSTTLTMGSSVSLVASGCTGDGTRVRWYQAADDQELTMPISPTVTTQYYARCERTVGTKVCLSDKSQNAIVTVVMPPPYNSVQSGNWNLPSTWNCNCIPDGTRSVQIMDTHTVTIPNAYTGLAKGVQFFGTGKLTMQGTGKVSITN
ncbi:MAG: M36 family metallopeptidase [Spirosoma sp.]|nr:M36 family metallopeptidase [Spirosoma sp.]